MSQTTVEKELQSLSEEERKRVLDDLYGEGASRLIDTPEQCEEALVKLQERIDRIDDSQKEQYNRALNECPEYVHDSDFRLQFLRYVCSFIWIQLHRTNL